LILPRFFEKICCSCREDEKSPPFSPGSKPPDGKTGGATEDSRKSAVFLALAVALETMVLAESGTLRLWAGSAAQAASGSLAGYDVCVFGDSNAPDRGFKAGHQQWLARVNPVLAPDLPTVEKARKAGIPVIAGAGENQRPRLDVEAPARVAFAQRELFEALPRTRV